MRNQAFPGVRSANNSCIFYLKKIAFHRFWRSFAAIPCTLDLRFSNYYMNKFYLLFAACLVGVLGLRAQISGVVYRDYNGNGVRQTTAPNIEPGVPGVEIYAYDATNTVVASTVSDSSGSYSLPFSVPVRVEFVIPVGLNCVNPAYDFSGYGGDGSSVRFVTAAGTENYAIQTPDDYVSNTNPDFFLPRHLDGNPLGGGTSGTANVFRSYTYNASGTSAATRNLSSLNVGSLYGVAYSKQAKKVFTAAFMKRHMGYGPMGSGGIYLLTPTASSFTVVQFYDMDANGHRTRAGAGAPSFGNGTSFSLNGAGTIATYLGSPDPLTGQPEGLGVVGVNGAGGRGLSATLQQDANDPAAFDQVCKVGLGDLDISEDGRYLFVMNLYSRHLFRLELNDPYDPTAVVAVDSFPMPNIAVSNGVLRPFGIGVHRGQVYVGAVASGENGGSNTVNGATDLYGYVLQVDNPYGAGVINATPILTFPLNYLKGSAIQNNPGASQWYPWNNNTAAVLTFNSEQTLPTPVISDLGFTDRGDLIIDMLDRSGHQYGYQTYQNLSGTTTINSYDVGGEILIAGRSCASGAYTLESNGSYNSNGTVFVGGAGNNQGPGGGEFFNQEFYPVWHNETSMGSVALLRGDNKALVTIMDPINEFSGGTAKFSAQNGSRTSQLQIYVNSETGTFAKANGLGDVEMAGDEPPLEVGNRVWADANANGIQDANELGIGNVSLELFADFDNNGIPDGAALGSVSTDATGHYYFNVGNVADGDPNAPGNQPGPQPNKTYLVRIGGSDWSGGLGTGDLAGLLLSLSNIGGAGQPDVRDNDATLASGTPQISLTTGKFGENDHRYDFGFRACVAEAGNSINLNCAVPQGPIGSPGFPGDTYVWAPATGLSNPNIPDPLASPSVTTTYTLTVNGACSDTVTVVVDNMPPSVSITGTTVVCNGGTTSLTANGGLSWIWNPGGSTSQSIAVGAGTYTVTATGANGCTNTSSVTVNTVQGSIGNYVWTDVNGNGLNDESASEGINGVTVELWDAIGNVMLASTLTANDGLGNPGYYGFVVCNTGDYYVKFPGTIGNAKPTVQTTTPGTDQNSDASPATGATPVFTIDVNGSGVAKDNLTIDAGYYVPACLGSTVWNDLDLDGTQDAGEVGVAGLAVTLYNAAGNVLSTTLTDAYGEYSFCNLAPGSYRVGFTLPQNYSFTQSIGGGDNGNNTNSDVDPETGLSGLFVLSSGENDTTADAGIIFSAPTTASVGNYVWFDMDEDGVQDPGEQGISGVTVTLYNNLNIPVAVTITDANGFYLFSQVQPGTYTVGFSLKPGLAFSPSNGAVSGTSNSDASPLNGKTAPFSVVAGDQITYVDAGMFQINAGQPLLGGLGDRVWYDTDQDGIQDIGEIGVEGVTVTLYQSDGVTVIATQTTDAFGNYVFNGLAQGSYVIGFSSLPAGYVLSPAGGPDSTANSDANPGTGKTAVIFLAAGQYNLTYDAGIYTTNSNNNNSIGDFVWSDLDRDGIQDPGEPGVGGVTVTLYDNANSPMAITVTDANGFYLFPNLPNGTYSIGFSNLPVGFVFSPAGAGPSATDSDPNPATGLTGSVVLSGNTHITDLDAGINLGNTKVGLASLGNRVWYDLDGDGIQDAAEGGVPGVTVILYQQDGITPLDTTVTNALGEYIFTGLESGNYVVGFSNLPAGFTVSPKNTDNQGLDGEVNSDANAGTGKTDVIVLGTGEDKMSVDLGIVPPAGTAALGNFVWFDLNNDGLQTTGEPGVQGVTVTLYDNSGAPLATTVTGPDGSYLFAGLAAGTYFTGFSNLPAGYNFTTLNADAAGVNGPANSDANPATGFTASISLGTGDVNLNLDAGLVSGSVASVGDFVWFDANHNGLQDTGEGGIGGVLVTLFDGSSNPVSSAITGPNGFYIFTNLVPGSYTIGFGNIPAGLNFTQQVGAPGDGNNSNANPLTGLTSSFTLAAGEHNPTIDAGLTTPQLAGLGNYVWHDVNENGLQDGTEPGVPGVLVTLYASDGISMLAVTTTDGDGLYSFLNLPAETYIVGFSNLPSGSTRTQMVGVLNNALNSDLPASGKTQPVTLLPGEFNPNIDAGIYFGFPVPAKDLVATLATMQSAGVCRVQWFTRDERNSMHFEIERSVDGTHFGKTGSKPASSHTNGSTFYSFEDDVAAVNQVPTLYYRIRLFDTDGKNYLSNTIVAHPDFAQNGSVQVYPSPFTDYMDIALYCQEETEFEISLTDASGRVVRKMAVAADRGENRYRLEQLDALSAGYYFIRVANLGNGEVFVRKVQK